MLFGSAYWTGLVDWLRDVMLGHGYISPGDMDLLTVTDDIDEVIALLDAADARRPDRHAALVATGDETPGDDG